METEETKQPLMKQYGWLFAVACGLLAILALLGAVVTVEYEGGDITQVHLWDYFVTHRKFNWTMYITLGLFIASIACALLHKIHPYFDMGAALCFLIALPLLVLSKEFFLANSLLDVDEVKIGWGTAIALVLCAVGIPFSISSSLSKEALSVRALAEDGILVAAAFVLNLVKLPIHTGGGSINFQMLPLFLIALRRGPVHGLICGGIIHGLITCLTDGWGFAFYPFDYLIAFGSVMVLGFFRHLIFNKEQKGYNLKGELFLLLGGLLATLVRFVGGIAGSMIVVDVSFYDALAYNAIYIPVSGAIAIAVIMAAYGPLAKLNARFPVREGQ